MRDDGKNSGLCHSMTGNIDDREAVAPLKHMGCPLYPDEPTPSA
jgi:hypothetical protein